MANARIALRIRQLVEATCDMDDVGKLFRLADANGDGELVREEFGAFIASLVKVYPGSSPPYFETKDIDAAFAAMNPSGSGVVLVDEFSHFLQASEEHHAFHDGLAAAAKENRVGYTESVTASHTAVDSAEAPGGRRRRAGHATGHTEARRRPNGWDDHHHDGRTRQHRPGHGRHHHRRCAGTEEVGRKGRHRRQP